MEVSALKYSGAVSVHARSPLLRLQSDERLISLTRRGNVSAFEALVGRYSSRLLAFCRHLLGSREDAEDVLQEIFAAAFNAILADDRPINVRPWLYRIARNRSLNHLRRIQAIGVDSMDVHYSEYGASTADKVHDREEFRLLVGDIHGLPETQRTALVLREMDALSYEQIAEAMETTVPSVKSLLVRARVSLAEAAQARLLSCEDVRLELGEVAEGLRRRPGAPVRRHLRACKRCSAFRTQLNETNKALAALLPIGPLFFFKRLLLGHFTHSASASSGGAASSAAGSGAGAAGSTAAGSTVAGSTVAGSTAMGSSVAGSTLAGSTVAGSTVVAGSGASGVVTAGVGALATKAAAGLAAAAIVTAGAVEVSPSTHRRGSVVASGQLAVQRHQDPPVAKPKPAPPSHHFVVAVKASPAAPTPKPAPVTTTTPTTPAAATPPPPKAATPPGRTQTQTDPTVLSQPQQGNVNNVQTNETSTSTTTTTTGGSQTTTTSTPPTDPSTGSASSGPSDGSSTSSAQTDGASGSSGTGSSGGAPPDSAPSGSPGGY